MKTSFQIGTVSGIQVFVHWTFPVLMAGIFAFYVYSGLTALAAAGAVALIMTVFLCVLLHELGHAFMARHYGIPTLDITMYPIGGVARLQRMPREPKQELLIALAGPAVNVVLAGFFYLLAEMMSGGAVHWTEAFTPGADILTMLMWMNAGLVVFNLLPAFPMDGGRVLRALLATQTSYRNATHIASFIGQFMAIIFIVYGLFTGMWTLPIVAVFVFMAARQEVQHVMQHG